ncbi:hypothetical protein LTR53_020552, partial [Teratosphaeriaceae sp. CCFEE 6253]
MEGVGMQPEGLEAQIEYLGHSATQPGGGVRRKPVGERRAPQQVDGEAGEEVDEEGEEMVVEKPRLVKMTRPKVP